MIRIQINNNQCIAKPDDSEDYEILQSVYEEMKIKHPSAFHVRRFMKPGWDGKIEYLKSNGSFSTGLLPQIRDHIKSVGGKIEYVDERHMDKNWKLPDSLLEVTPRKYQIEAITSVAFNYVGKGKKKIWFPRGIIKAATNAGKTIIAAGLHRTFKGRTIFVINSKELFDQAVKEIPLLLPAEDIGIIASGYPEKWGKFTIAMVQTLSSRIDEYKPMLIQYSKCIIDECDLSDNKTYKRIIQNLYNTYVRVGMSGTALTGKLAKYKPTHQNIKGFYGDQLYEITNAELIEQGFSSKVKITIVKGNTKVKINDYKEEYDFGIVKSKERNKKAIKRIKRAADKKRLPALVICKTHEHVKRLFKRVQKEFGDKYRVEWVHHKRKERKQVVDDFRAGKIDILVGSLILKRGMNFKYLQYMLNASGGDNPAGPLQLLGRVMRKHEDAKITTKYYEDFYDEGTYLRRHSKHRVQYYKDEKLPIKILK